MHDVEIPPLAPAAERIAAGMALLDEHAQLDSMIPPNWRELIDVDELNMGSGRYCVLGQIANSLNPEASYWNVVDTHPELQSDVRVDELGFNLAWRQETWGTRHDQWAELQEACKTALRPTPNEEVPA